MAIADRAGKRVTVVEADADEVAGVNTRDELAAVERIFQDRAREGGDGRGRDPDRPADGLLQPRHQARPRRDDRAERVLRARRDACGQRHHPRLLPHRGNARSPPARSIGPFARLRPGRDIAAKAKVGNFVEIKNAVIDAGAKVNHLTYIGDAHIGAGTNIGAGTITCNYDGFDKYHTEIGADAFIGSNSALVAPVTIGDGAYVGVGQRHHRTTSPPDALAVARGRQVVKPGWAASFRELKASARKKPE